MDAFVAAATQWSAETSKLRSILLDCGLDEQLKWRQPCYTYAGANVAIVQGFKAHCSVMFFRGALLQDPAGHLVPPGKNSRAAMRLQLTSVQQVRELERPLRSFVAQAIELEESGESVDFEESRELELPEELRARLAVDPALSAAFHALTPGRRRGYVIHFSGAKQSKTRTARIEKCAPRILAGKGLNDR